MFAFSAFAQVDTTGREFQTQGSDLGDVADIVLGGGKIATALSQQSWKRQIKNVRLARREIKAVRKDQAKGKLLDYEAEFLIGVLMNADHIKEQAIIIHALTAPEILRKLKESN